MKGNFHGGELHWERSSGFFLFGIPTRGPGGFTPDICHTEGVMEVFLTPEDLSKILKVSRVWVYKLCQQGRIPFFRIAGKVIRFSPAEIDRWMSENRGTKYNRNKKMKER